MVRILVTSLSAAVLAACDLEASAKDYARRVCAQRCGIAGEACQQRCERQTEAPWSAWLVRVEAMGLATSAAKVTLETRDGPTGAVTDELVLSQGNPVWPATDSELRLSRSDDGRGVTVLGYSGRDGGRPEVVLDATEVRLGWLSSAGVDWATTLPSPRTNISAAASARGERFWVAGPPAYGIQEVQRGGSVLQTQIPIVSGEFVQALAVRNETLFVATRGVLRSFALPYGSAPTSVELQSSVMTDFELVDLDDTIPGVDTLYVTREERQPGLRKYVRRQGAWGLAWETSAAITVDDPVTCQRLAVLPRKPGATILCVRGSRSVVRFDDDIALNGAAPAPTLFAITSPPSEFRGIAVVPETP
jgi:hypothetical protein